MPPRALRNLLAAATVIASVTTALAPPAWSEPASGAYLAARAASMAGDHDKAARYYAAALSADPANPTIAEGAMVSFVNAGRVAQAVTVARTLRDKGVDSQLADLVALAGAIHRSDFDRAAQILGDGGGFSPLLDGLMKGWILMGQGRMTDALAQFDTMQDNAALRAYGQTHKALALAMVGNFDAAEKILAGDENGALWVDRSSVIAHAQILVEMGERDKAVAVLDRALSGASDPEIEELRRHIADGGKVAFDRIARPEDGAAEVLYTLADALTGEQNRALSLFYGRLAQYLRPQSVKTLLVVAETLEAQGQHDLAIKVYEDVPADHPMAVSAGIGRAEALFAADRKDEAIAAIRDLARTHPDNATVQMTLGDMLRRNSDFEGARAAYSAAIELIDAPQREHWFLFYARGITNERTDHWAEAEADFRKALELEPDQPLVLNYLGYSLVEKGEKLDEAQRMIEKAVEKRPEDGYITDSLGWVLYRLGKYADAVEPMERAVELIPDDPIINDHLGDVYWMVGRKLEARFQWRRALSFGPEEEDAVRIRRKLEVGLDQVLQEERDNGNGG